MAEYRYNLRGEIDLGNSPQLRSDLLAEIARHGADLTIDCSELTFIDCSVVSVMLDVRSELEADGRRMLIVNASRAPRRVFELLGLTELLQYSE
jgi:stage II sporulation protein AA (anti-sigma F factor antagonist)